MRMQQIKVFSFRVFPELENTEIEKTINSWLSENPNVKVICFNNGIIGNSLFVHIIYEGQLGKGITDLKY